MLVADILCLIVTARKISYLESVKYKMSAVY